VGVVEVAALGLPLPTLGAVAVAALAGAFDLGRGPLQAGPAAVSYGDWTGHARPVDQRCERPRAVSRYWLEHRQLTQAPGRRRKDRPPKPEGTRRLTSAQTHPFLGVAGS
jgi:hypothetical protein